MIFSKKEEKKREVNKLSLLIDIQSGLVRVAVLRPSADFPAEIVHSVSRPVEGEIEKSGDLIIKTKTMLTELERALKDCIDHVKIPHDSIDTVHYVFSTPWIVTQSRIIKKQFDTDTEVTEKMIQDILDSERVSLLETFKKEKLDDTYDFDLVIIEQKIFDMRLNGYSVESSHGKKARTFEISFAVSMCSEKIIKKIHSVVASSLHVKKEVHHSGLLLQYIALRSLVSHGEYASIHVHGEITDCIVVRRGLSSSVTSFPYGIDTLTRKLSKILKNTKEASNSLITLYEGNKLETKVQEKVGKAVSTLITDWYSGLVKSPAITGANGMPHCIYLSVCSYSIHHLPIFKKFLEESGYEVRIFEKHISEVYVSALYDTCKL